MAKAEGLVDPLSQDSHPLAHSIHFPPAGPKAERLEALRTEAKTRMSRFPGKRKKFGGRPYLNFNEYQQWPNRLLKDEIKVSPGVDANAWNKFVDQHGGEGQAQLAGVKLRKLRAPFSRDDFHRSIKGSDVNSRNWAREMIAFSLFDPAEPECGRPKRCSQKSVARSDAYSRID